MKTRDEIEMEHGCLFGECPDGLEGVPVGWLDMVERALDKWSERRPLPRITQIKNKFARIVVYGEHITTAMAAELETNSLYTCEECGAPGDRRVKKGWHYVQCDLCAMDAAVLEAGL